MSTPSSPAAPSATVPASPVVTAWPYSAQLAVAFLLGSATTMLGLYAYTSSRGAARPSHLEYRADSAYRIDLNRADRAELLQLPGVGEALANRVLAYRRERGGFRNVDELRGVSGIGPATLERLRPLVQVVQIDDGELDDPPAEVPPPTITSRSNTSMPRATGKKEEALKQPIDVNHASAEDLQHLPGIGPKMSQRIIDERHKKPFQKIDDLRRVSGIGPKTLEKLRPYVVVKGGAVRVATTDEE